MTPLPPRSTLFPYTTLFRSTHEPIWISYQAVAALLDGRPSDRRMMATRFQEFADIEMGRALGRVLAHEVGHVILGAPFHRPAGDRKSTRLNSSHRCISYAVF